MSFRRRTLSSLAARGYELRDANPRAILVAGGILTALLVLTLFIAHWTLDYLTRAESKPEPIPSALTEDHPRESLRPKLQIDAPKDLQHMRELETARLTSYGRDPLTGAIHIPIDRAMQLTLARGLPTRSTGSAPKTPTPTNAPPATNPADGTGATMKVTD